MIALPSRRCHQISASNTEEESGSRRVENVKRITRANPRRTGRREKAYRSELKLIRRVFSKLREMRKFSAILARKKLRQRCRNCCTWFTQAVFGENGILKEPRQEFLQFRALPIRQNLSYAGRETPNCGL